MRSTTIIGLILENKGGVLGEVARALVESDVDVHGFSLETGEGHKRARLVTDDAGQALEALEGLGVGRRIEEGLVLPAPQGSREVSRLGERLARAEVDARTGFLVTGDGKRPRLVLGVDDAEDAMRALGSDVGVTVS